MLVMLGHLHLRPLCLVVDRTAAVANVIEYHHIIGAHTEVLHLRFASLGCQTSTIYVVYRGLVTFVLHGGVDQTYEAAIKHFATADVNLADIAVGSIDECKPMYGLRIHLQTQQQRQRCHYIF